MTGTETPAPIEPEDRDWTYVLTDGCAECGFTPPDPREVADRLRALLPTWSAALQTPDARVRPRPTTWSTVEYACHVRDVCRIMRGRLELMLAQDDPTFANWDQDATAVDDDYFHQDPAAVAAELQREAMLAADAFAGVREEQWERPGRRSNGSLFTVATLAVYFLHDVAHHTVDITRPSA